MSETRAITAAETALPPGYRKKPWGACRPNALQSALIALARHTFLHHGRARHRLTNLITRLGRPLDVEFRNCRYRIEGRNNLMEYGLLLHPTYNAQEIDFLLQGCRKDGIAVDIGANIGLYSLPLAAAVGSRGRVISIDANAGVLARLVFNAESSGLSQIMPVHRAVGDHDGKVDLSICRDDLSIVSVAESATGAVPMQPLADILAAQGVKHVDVLKIDIEGFEDAALAPFLESAPEQMLPRRIVLERGGPDGGDYPGCAAAFKRRGYKLAGRTRSNSLYRRA
ncbi:MAG: FkbM family methyltransferase [Rhodobacteraceae bacterium]|nr:FkbM family methyltransferase [Paracoccaceae bacterium]MCP5340824.1 FkbM family methyltransferase [Paracoccaceae bacterium]